MQRALSEAEEATRCRSAARASCDDQVSRTSAHARTPIHVAIHVGARVPRLAPMMESTVDGRRKSILITGCSSGIGLDAALTLRRRGWGGSAAMDKPTATPKGETGGASATNASSRSAASPGAFVIPARLSSSGRRLAASGVAALELDPGPGLATVDRRQELRVVGLRRVVGRRRARVVALADREARLVAARDRAVSDESRRRRPEL